MKTKITIIDENNIEQNIINEAGLVIAEGGLVVFPTETVYGLGANALDKIAVEKIFKAKGRPQDNPLIVHVADFNIEYLVKEIPYIAKEIMNRYWPGPITLIFNKSDLIPITTSAGLNTVGIRMPANLIARKLIEAAGTPIAAPSANISGRPSPTDVESCIEDLNGKIEYILGGDKSKVGLESTIVDCTCTPICILRPGAITIEMLREIDEKIYIDKNIMSKPKDDFKPKAPGMKYRHYAPKSPVKIICGDLEKTVAKINEIVQNNMGNKKIGIIATDETKAKYCCGTVISLGSRKHLDSVGKNLFEVLRSFDDTDVDLILSEAFEEKGIGVAIMNRLKKSAGFDMIEV
ncbi:threonylcarbamoyl-AMP synthase [Clostridium sp. CM028]|uniref:L-threonylcarbamoyladenylate synthase n=1 Tax=unclassified Clostridium TaxID=2614128 RepID=UPI001C0C0F93|nr:MULTISPECIES: L-threonylcarbamoyladenylate synthase [unclassified Clostridium]MBU3092570.1 threonylcarbamoyl-AMP synthase [Clostridium sp. CF011]MBW9146229.1 threonylcarbamoyl-AMP synthase [Clostridium sp. CM027]MBW9149701.1 threonylcarbamoyl-AMP synthase [Clostridium sp. CM028]UVE39792.1 threonylcarbamoyl-AMP synthase [Clostridium sp. CM027]WAG68699.1 threonylcarbamoyl-AMP synthase [Clostridium sp. CF011]